MNCSHMINKGPIKCWGRRRNTVINKLFGKIRFYETFWTYWTLRTSDCIPMRLGAKWIRGCIGEENVCVRSEKFLNYIIQVYLICCHFCYCSFDSCRLYLWEVWRGVQAISAAGVSVILSNHDGSFEFNWLVLERQIWLEAGIPIWNLQTIFGAISLSYRLAFESCLDEDSTF